MTSPNFLVLDEPTNDFDIETLNVLEEFLENFSGCLILVSHDRYFMDRLVDHLFVFEGDGKIRVFNGNYSDYREELEQEQEAPAPKPKEEERTRPVPERKKPTLAERKELENIQSEIDALEQESRALIEELNRGEGDHVRLNSLSQRISQIAADTEAKTARWMELEEKVNGGA